MRFCIQPYHAASSWNYFYDLSLSPTAVDDTATMEVDNAITFDVLANDTHPIAGANLIVSAVHVEPVQGSVVIESDNRITFTPNVGFIGVAVITYTVQDATGDEAIGVLRVTYTAVDYPPVAEDDTATVVQGETLAFDPRANDTHAGSESMSVVGATLDSGQGTLSFSAVGITYTPPVSFSGTAVISYTVEDENSQTDTGTITVTVTGDGVPTPQPDTVTTYEETAVQVSVLANDTHEDSDSMTVVAASVSASEGVATFNSTSVTFTPATGFTGTSVVTYTVEDTDGDQVNSTLTVTVDAYPLPVATDDSVTIAENSSATLVDVLSNDTHAVDALTVVSASGNAAELTVAVVSNQVQITPVANFNGTSTVTYVVEDSQGQQDSGDITVTVSVDGVPTAVDDSATTDENVTIDIDVVSNDTHNDDSLTVTGVNLVSGSGAVSIVSNQVRFVPQTSFTGTAVIDYTVEDSNGDTDTGSVTVTVTNVAPTAVDDTASTNQDQSVLIDVLANDTHPNSETLTIYSVSIDGAEGTAVEESGQIRYTPASGFYGTATITYEVTDGDGNADDRDTGQVLVTVAQDHPPVAVNDTATTVEETAVTFDVIANDTHAGSEGMTVVAATLDSGSGSLSYSGVNVTYTPAAAFVGTAVITYTVEDATGDQDTATVSVTVTSISPVAVNDTATTTEDTLVTVDVLSNDTHNLDSYSGEYHRYWRVFATSGGHNNNQYWSVSGLALKESFGGYDLTTPNVGGIASSVRGTFFLENAFDDDPETDWSPVTYPSEIWIGYDFNNPVHIVEVELTARNDNGYENQMILDFILQYSDDGVTWTNYWEVTGQSEYSSGEARIFQTPDYYSKELISIDSVTLNNPSEGTAVINAGKIDFTPASGVTGAVVMTYVIIDETGDTDTGTLTVTVNPATPANDPFDEPVSTLFGLMIDGSTSGVGKTNCNLWANKAGIDGATDATEWRTSSGTREEVDLRIWDDFTTDDYWVRCRFKVTTAGTAKTYVHFNNEYMDDYEVWFDITDDATTDAARVVHVGANVSDAVAGKHPTNGFIYVKFRINFSTQSNANGTNTINMSDQDNTGDNLMDVNNLTVIATQDYTFELIS